MYGNFAPGEWFPEVTTEQSVSEVRACTKLGASRAGPTRPMQATSGRVDLRDPHGVAPALKRCAHERIHDVERRA